MIFNVHTHINDDQEILEASELIQECYNNDVKKIVIIGYDLKSSIRAIEIANKFEGVYAAIGIHPSDVGKEGNTIEELEKIIINDKVIAIGEIGLDYHWESNPSKEIQKEWFVKQLQLANKYKKPIIIHSRDAMGDTLEILKEYKQYYDKGIMHCYAGSIETSKELEKLGFYFSFAGPLTYKNANQLRSVAKEIPLDRILIETDDPYLTPVPHRGKRNHPSYVIYVAKELANIKGVSYEEICDITYKNSIKVFNL